MSLVIIDIEVGQSILDDLQAYMQPEMGVIEEVDSQVTESAGDEVSPHELFVIEEVEEVEESDSQVAEGVGDGDNGDKVLPFTQQGELEDGASFSIQQEEPDKFYVDDLNQALQAHYGDGGDDGDDGGNGDSGSDLSDNFILAQE
ncbi:MAG: hypothetical protein GY786_02185 [Proteobacteria bacterium]|nr:hypothetical protein [Pseudomonadota bacterium]